jgi:rhodanese-related sulfurtransferase
VTYAPAVVTYAPPPGSRTIEQVLADSRARLDRLSPQQAQRAVSAGAVLVDIRPAAQRAAEGEIPGALIVERPARDWRVDPAAPARLPQASYDAHVIVFCSEGYTSSLAAAALQDLGVRNATDLDGGFVAWQTAGLPVVSANHSDS